MRDIVAQTPRPAHVRNSVSEFLEKFSDSKYVAMHWRYNDDDWAMHCEFRGSIFHALFLWKVVKNRQIHMILYEVAKDLTQ